MSFTLSSDEPGRNPDAIIPPFPTSNPKDAAIMPDPRVVKLARLLVEYSTRIQKGDRVAIEAQPRAEPLGRAIYEEGLLAGGHPYVFFSPQWGEELVIKHGYDEQITRAPALRKEAYERFESRIRIYAQSNTRNL